MARLGNEGVDIGLERRVAPGVDPCADAAEAIGLAVRQFCNQQGLLGLAADRCAVFRIECDVEHGAEFRLQRQALAHAGLDAAIVIDDGQCRPWRLLPEQGDAGMKRYRHATTVPSLTRAFQLAARKSCVQH